MFEKEAEEWVKKEFPLLDVEHINLEESITEYRAFKDGAELGYNKAKEEIQEKKYSSFDFVMKYENEKFKCKYKSGKEFESVDGETWKEMVLPELKESKL